MENLLLNAVKQNSCSPNVFLIRWSQQLISASLGERDKSPEQVDELVINLPMATLLPLGNIP